MSKSTDSSAVSEYEQLRLQNIKEREELFKEVIEAKNLAHKAFKKTYKRKAPSTPKTPKEVLPPREKSKRISIGRKSRIVEKFMEGYELRTLAPEEIFYLQHGQRAARLEAGKETLSSYAQNMSIPEGSRYAKKSKMFIDRLPGYRVQSRKIMMMGITCSSVHPSNHMILGCAGNNDGRILLGRMEFDNSQDPMVVDYNIFIPHTARIFHQSWDTYDYEKMITSSYDGTVRIFDIRNLQSSLLFGDEKFIDEEGGCFTHAQIERDTYLISKGNDSGGWISMMDTREGPLPVKDYYVSETVAYMKSIDVHPLNKKQFLTADGDGVVKLFDTRFMKRKSGNQHRSRSQANVDSGARTASAIATFQNDEPESFAHWSPVTGDKVVVSNRSGLKMYDARNIFYNWVPVQERLRLCQTERRTPPRGYWHPLYDDVYITCGKGVMNIKGDWGIHVWDVKHSSTKSFTRAHCISNSNKYIMGKLSVGVDTLTIHPNMDVMIAFSNQGFVSLLEYKNELTKKIKKDDLMVSLVNDAIQDIDEDIAADDQVDNDQANEAKAEDDPADINQAEGHSLKDCNIEIATGDLNDSDANNTDVDDMGDDKRSEVGALNDEDHEMVQMSTKSDRGECSITDYGPQEKHNSPQ